MVAQPSSAPFAIENADGTAPFIIVCDHASNAIPARFANLGLTEQERADHIAWDPGALAVSRHLSKLAGAPLFRSTVSRLMLDCNRPETSATLIPDVSETTVIPGNTNLSAEERAERIAEFHRPYHDGLTQFVDEQLARRHGKPLAVVAIHTFTPVYKGERRDLEIGVLFDKDTRLALPMLDDLKSLPGVDARANEPYSPADEVYYTLDRHAVARGLANVMIEIRNDTIPGEAEANIWAKRLKTAIDHALATCQA